MSWPPPLTSAAGGVGPAASVVAVAAAATTSTVLTAATAASATASSWSAGCCDLSRLPGLGFGRVCCGHCRHLRAHFGVLGGEKHFVSSLEYGIVGGGIEVHIGDVAADS